MSTSIIDFKLNLKLKTVSRIKPDILSKRIINKCDDVYKYINHSVSGTKFDRNENIKSTFSNLLIMDSQENSLKLYHNHYESSTNLFYDALQFRQME
mmetsp:Transcript_29233/g.40671  ORF Transcript_29233/g.40671 Transcript_29233/m.40671 type:complete len:97 (+) Transcript_29233:6097-6387(+)